MATLCAKLKQRQNPKYRKIVSTDATIYSIENLQITSSTPYSPGAALEEGDWFSIQKASEQEYKIDLIESGYNSIDFGVLSGSEFGNVDFVFVEIGDLICFQKISRAKLVSKKCIVYLGQGFQYHDNRKEIVINDIPDAVYNKTSDTLYFRRLESITGIFKGIDQLYKEATDEETAQFLSNDFIQLKDEYNASNVKTANRKRIALAKNTLANLDESDRKNIFTYIGEYCPDLKANDTSFEVGSEDELKLLLYGIEQRFYTTVVGGEKRIANSVVPLG